jgi:hypothetical protein
VIQKESGQDVELSPVQTSQSSATGPSQPAPVIQSGQTADEIVDAVVEGITKKS